MSTTQIEQELHRLYRIAYDRPRQYRTGIGRRIARLERQLAKLTATETTQS